MSRHRRRRSRRRNEGPLEGLFPKCEACARHVGPFDFVRGLLNLRGVSYAFRLEDGSRERRRVRWLCGECRSKAHHRRRHRREDAPAEKFPGLQPHQRLGLQRENDLMWYAGEAEGEPRWVSSRRDAMRYTSGDESDARRLALVEAGHLVRIVMLFDSSSKARK
jgi:hypothetical protein